MGEVEGGVAMENDDDNNDDDVEDDEDEVVVRLECWQALTMTGSSIEGEDAFGERLKRLKSNYQPLSKHQLAMIIVA